MSKRTEKARQEFERASAENKTAFDEMSYATTQLFKAREKATEALHNAMDFFHGILNIPNDFLEIIENAKTNLQNFEISVQTAQKEVEKFNPPSGGNGIAATAAGIAGAGIIVAVGGPTAAMAIATTFGIASTGVAISSLSGAAATTAALAWLGGGAIAAGGAGMAGGMGVLIAIPVIGVVIAGLTVISSGVFFGLKDKNIFAEYEQNMIFIKGATKMYQDNTSEISVLSTDTLQAETKIQMILKSFVDIDKNFSNWNENQNRQMRELIETIDDTSNKLNRRIPIDLEKCNQEEYYKKRLTVLSALRDYPESPNPIIKAKVGDAGVYCIAEANGWKLELNKAMLHYRIRTPEKRRIACGDKKEINMYFNSIIK
jgi:hypothetical protein